MLTLNIVKAINTESFDIFSKFFEISKPNEFTVLCHYRFFYTYPAFGKKWINNENNFQYHRFEPFCEICKSKPDYNRFGIGSIYLLNSGKNIVFRCENHLLAAKKFGIHSKSKQLTLFNC
jgi:hypothetical protein